MRRVLVALSLLLLASIAGAAQPQISVGALFDYMEPGRSQLLKRVRNSGDATAYVRVEITRMHFDGQGNVTEAPVDAAALARGEPGVQGLIASPSRMIIPAGHGQQATRLVFRGARTQEQHYRVRYVPVVPDAGEFSLDAQQAQDYQQGVQAGVNVFTGYGTVVFVPPVDVRYDTRVQGLQVTNAGNATVVLDNLRQCRRARPDDCGGGVKVHVFPGRQHMLAEEEGYYSRFDLLEGPQRRTIDTRS
ncbi:CS1 fimbrial subunit B flags: Precursor [Stenotrophomonas sp. 24(2023)]|uniref:CS1 fimbrial subunit B flags: Precursor n=1 Tax=Stenotrophomonas sp. 24(2023) TaxID=3068324 RepID=UPI0027DF4A00|nr:CS1 fimbrial subunit B flags: Precursor [Stenotrophomonas sp. 24(2023)]WMJ67816.1 CS1 fimbrial subunit B flags: Precursor [Stenotrophomonas sp. 24(2023)]